MPAARILLFVYRPSPPRTGKRRARKMGRGARSLNPRARGKTLSKADRAHSLCPDEPRVRARDQSSCQRSAAKLLTRDEPRRIAANIAKLPELMHKP